MRIVRAWPDHPPAGRPHVVDGWPRVPVNDYDYSGLLPACGQEPGVVSMDWDTACSLEDLTTFAHYASQAPGMVLAGPCRTYFGPVSGQWNLAQADGTIYTDLPAVADLFGFGLVYLPKAMIAGYLAEQGGAPLTDQWFASWHYAHHGPVAVCWQVSPVHLHYPEAQAGVLRLEEHPDALAGTRAAG